MASSMSTQTMGATVKSVHQGNIGGQAVTIVSCRLSAGANQGLPKTIFGNGVSTTDISFVLSGGTAPAVGDTFNIVAN